MTPTMNSLGAEGRMAMPSGGRRAERRRRRCANSAAVRPGMTSPGSKSSGWVRGVGWPAIRCLLEVVCKMR
jgi:hypothetical protein